MKITEELIEQVWNKGRIHIERDPGQWRKDSLDRWIERDKYNDHTSEHGWEIDCILSLDKGGEDELSNMRPMHWQNRIIRDGGKILKEIYEPFDNEESEDRT